MELLSERFCGSCYSWYLSQILLKMIIIAPLLFPENPTEGRDFPLYTPLLDDEDVLTTDFLGEQK